MYLYVFQQMKSYFKNDVSYGISKNPENVYIFVFISEYLEKYCENCDEKYTDDLYKWCKPCQANNFKKFTNWASGNEIIDNLIQELQLKINNYEDIVFEWIPYNQFDDIKETNEDSFTIATWKNGLLKYDASKFEYMRDQNIKVTLKYLNNSQNITNDFLNEVWNFP